MNLKFYGFSPTRSARVRWTLQELDVPFEAVEDRKIIGSDELRKLHPLGKVPVLEADNKVLIESAAISTSMTCEF